MLVNLSSVIHTDQFSHSFLRYTNLFMGRCSAFAHGFGKTNKATSETLLHDGFNNTFLRLSSNGVC